MAYILDPTESADDDGYAGVNDLSGSTAAKDVLDKNPLFRHAERFIIGFIPAADVRKTGGGEGRNYEHRDEVIGALQFIAASYIIQGAEKAGDTTITQGSGDLKSETETIGPITRTKSYDVGASVSRGGGNNIGAADRASFLYEEGLEILKGLGVSTATLSDDGVFVVQTGSRVKDYGDDVYDIYPKGIFS